MPVTVPTTVSVPTQEEFEAVANSVQAIDGFVNSLLQRMTTAEQALATAQQEIVQLTARVEALEAAGP